MKIVQEKPYAINTLSEKRLWALDKTDNCIAGAGRGTGAGAPPGKTHMHIGLKYLDQKR